MDTIRTVLADIRSAIDDFTYPIRRKIKIFFGSHVIDENRSPRPQRRNGRERRRIPNTKNLWIFPLFMLYEEFFFRVFNKQSFFYHLLLPLLFGFAFGFLFSAICTLFSRKANRIVTIVIMMVMALYYTVETEILHSFQNYMNLSTIFKNTGGVMGDFGGEFLNSIVGAIPRALLFFAPAVLYIIFGKKYPTWRYKPVVALVLAGVFLVLTLITAGFVMLGSAKEKYTSQFEFDESTHIFGLMTGTRLDIKYAIFGNEAENELEFSETSSKPEPSKSSTAPEPVSSVTSSVIQSSSVGPKVDTSPNTMNIDFQKVADSTSDKTVKNLALYAKSVKPTNKNAYTGLFKGKNVILITAEAWSDAFVSKELTPNMYRLIHNGFYFSDFYQPAWGGSTITGEYSHVMGLVPCWGTDSILKIKSNNNYFTIGNQMQRLGYYSAAYHDGSYTFYDRNKTHTNLGYSTYTAQGNGLEDIAGAWPGDDKMFNFTMDTYMDKQPFSIYYMSVDGHAAYTKDHVKTKRNIEYVKSIVGDKYKEKTLYYICYNMELEKALGTMITKLEEKGIANDTVIVMVTDHYPYGLLKSKTWDNNQDYYVDLMKHPDTLPWERDCSGLIIWSGCLENEYKDMAVEISAPTYSLDIVPTLSNLFGLEYDSRLLVGRDVFSDADPLVLWANYSWVTEKGKYYAKEKKFYPNEGVTVDQDYIDQMNSIVKNKVVFSRGVGETDFYKVLFGPDDVK